MTRSKRAAVAAIVLLAATAMLLYLMGRPPICTCGAIDLWVGEPNSSRTSQMLSDWYSPSHIVHGFLFFAGLWLVGWRWPLERRFLIALAIEAAWEIVENTPLIINRYREETAALGYTGDSVLNSMSDIAMMIGGFGLAVFELFSEIFAQLLHVELHFFEGFGHLLHFLQFHFGDLKIFQDLVGSGLLKSGDGFAQAGEIEAEILGLFGEIGKRSLHLVFRLFGFG